LIRECQEDILFDGVMMENVLTWLTALSNSKVRAFRHTSCLALYAIVDTMIDVCQNSLKKDLSKVEKQLDAAKSKKGQNKKVTELTEQCTELQEHIISLDNHMSSVFEDVFANRYRDSVANIRALSIESVGGWILNYPSKFLNNNTLKYLGWALNDEVSSIRSTALVFLAKLFDKEEYHERQATFIKRFLARLVEMAVSETDISTCVEAIKTVTVLLRHKLLGSDSETHTPMIQQIHKLLFDENASVRYHAAVFIFHDLAKPVADKKKQARTKSSSTKKRLDVQLEDLIDFMRDQCEEIPLVAYYIAENFWKLTDTVKDWEQMIDFLTEREEELQSEQDTLNLIRLLTAAAQKVNDSLALKTSATDNAKIPKSGKTRKVQEEEQKEDQENMSGIVAAALPQLMKKYQAEPEKILELVQIPRQLNLESFSDHHLQKDFDELLKLLHDIFWKSSDPVFFRCIAGAFKYLVSTEYSLKNKAKTACDEIVREMITKLKEAVGSLQNTDNDEDMEQTKDQNFTIRVTLQRIRDFTSEMDIDLQDLSTDMSNILDERIKQRTDSKIEIDDNSTAIIMRIMFHKTIWLVNQLAEKKDIDDFEIDNVKDERDKFLQQLIDLLSSEFELALTAFKYICDLFIYFSPIAPPTGKAAETAGNKVSQLNNLNIHLTYEQSTAIMNFLEKALDTGLEGNAQATKMQNIKKQGMVVGLTKAINNSTADVRLSDVVIAHYVSHGPEVTEAVKYLIQMLKKTDYSSLWEHEYAAMCHKFKQYEEASESATSDAKKKQAEKQYDEFVTLINKLSLLHFWGHDNKHISLVINACMIHVFDRLTVRHRMLDGLTKYAVKLDKKDATEAITQLNGLIETSNLESEDKDVRDSVKDFKKLLNGVSKGEKGLAAGKGKKTTKKKGKQAESEDEEAEEEEEQSEEDENAPTTPVISRAHRRRQRTTSTSQQLQFDEETSQIEKPTTTTTTTDESDTEERGTKRKRSSQEEEEDDETQVSNAGTQENELPEDEELFSDENPSKKQKLL
jgi:hypothetical protein